MKKLLFLIQIAGITLLSSLASNASGDDHGWGHHGHHHHHPHYREVVRYYYPRPRPYREVITYYPRPRPYREAITYYPRPRPGYYAQPHYQSYQDPRSTQGLAGGVVGSVFGYQLGGGDPVMTGLGAAAGSYLGNEIGR